MEFKLELTTYQLQILQVTLEEEIDRNHGCGYEDIDTACREILGQLGTQALNILTSVNLLKGE